MCFYNTSVTLLGCTWNKVLSEGRQLLEEADLANLTEFSVFLILLLLCRICVEKYKTVCTNSRSWSLASKWIHCAKDTKEVRCSGRIWASRTPENFLREIENLTFFSWNWQLGIYPTWWQWLGRDARIDPSLMCLNFAPKLAKV